MAAKPPATDVIARREQRRREMDLLEQRKAGTIEPEQDEEGNVINPHIPQYISAAPWYLPEHKKPSLKHQKGSTGALDSTLGVGWYQRGAVRAVVAQKFRAGACTNCGAMTHDAKSCLERPRAKGARWTGRDIAPDEVLQPDLPLDYDGKHDPWNGYDPSEHWRVVDQWNKVEEERKRIKAEALSRDAQEHMEAEGAAAAAARGKTEAELDAELKGELMLDEGEDTTAAMTKIDKRTKTTVRNLRIREDTAKYLRNLDTSSAFYDPKTRSMREDPTPHLSADERQYFGDNYYRNTGDIQGYQEMNAFVYEAAERGQEIHLQGVPSQAQQLLRQFQEKKEQLKARQKKSVVAQYGGEEYLSKPDDLPLGATEAYTEFGADGRVIKGVEAAVAKSKYEEDQFPLNHSSVWGSYWRSGQWGYKCCHSSVRGSYCTGEAGKQAAANSELQTEMNIQRQRQHEEALAKRAAEAGTSSALSSMSAAAAAAPSSSGGTGIKFTASEEQSLSLDEQKVRAHMARARERDAMTAEEAEAASKNKRGYNRSSETDVMISAEEMEAYKRTRVLRDDPMAAYAKDKK